MRNEIEDGMGCSGLIPNQEEKRLEQERSNLKWVERLQARDFENGAVIDHIQSVFKAYNELTDAAQFAAELLAKIYKINPMKHYGQGHVFKSHPDGNCKLCAYPKNDQIHQSTTGAHT